MKTTSNCIECGQPVSRGVHLFSNRIYGHSLCMKDQFKIEESGATARTVDLYLALKARSFPVVLEYWDDHRHIDIALPGKLYIEVNDPYYDKGRRIMADLSRAIYALEKKIPSLVIPVSILENPVTFEFAVNEISKACRLTMKKPIVTGMKLAFSRVHLQ
jgi:hypothetical protein